jgi:hypothetical protein
MNPYIILRLVGKRVAIRVDLILAIWELNEYTTLWLKNGTGITTQKVEDSFDDVIDLLRKAAD